MIVDPKKINLSEKDLESYLFEHPEMVRLPYSDTPVMAWFGRQLQVPSGIIDLIGLTENDIIVLVELKNTEFEASHLTQIQRYSRDIEEAYTLAGGCHYLQIIKMLIGTKPPKHTVLVEANSMDIIIKTLSINFDLDIGGCWEFTEEYNKELHEKLLRLSSLEVISRLAKESDNKMRKEVGEVGEEKNVK